MNENFQRQSVLIIDDTPVQLMSLGRMLSCTYDVKMAKTGEEGLKLAKAHDVDLVLLDLYMPDITGFEVLARLQDSEETKGVPVILITGSASNEDEVRGLSRGAVDYIRKPFTETIVRLRVEMHLRLVNQMKIIESLSLTDGLTSIGNRRAFDRDAKALWGIARRTQDCFGVLMLDIDKFKNFNDKHGHLNGDICLKTVAHTMQESLKRITDSVYRWGGEEFVALLPGTDLEGTLLTPDAIRETIEATSVTFGNETDSVTVSIGAGSVKPGDEEFEQGFTDFLTKINNALRLAKKNGRNRVEIV